MMARKPARMVHHPACLVIIPPPPGPAAVPCTERAVHDACDQVMAHFSKAAQVAPHRSYVSPERINEAIRAYHLDVDIDLPALAALLNDARKEDIYHADDLGLYSCSTLNPVGRWDSWVLDERCLRTDAAGRRFLVHAMTVLEWATSQGPVLDCYPWWFPDNLFTVAVGDPVPAWIESHDFHPATASQPARLVPSPRFLPLLTRVAEQLPHYWVIPVRYV